MKNILMKPFNLSILILNTEMTNDLITQKRSKKKELNTFSFCKIKAVGIKKLTVNTT